MNGLSVHMNLEEDYIDLDFNDINLEFVDMNLEIVNINLNPIQLHPEPIHLNPGTDNIIRESVRLFRGSDDPERDSKEPLIKSELFMGYTGT